MDKFFFGGSNETKNLDSVAIQLPKALILNDDGMEISLKEWIQQWLVSNGNRFRREICQ
jgi:hypothetical protein